MVSLYCQDTDRVLRCFSWIYSCFSRIYKGFSELADGGNGQERAEVITSPGIQKRYQKAVKGRKRQFEVNAEIWLLDEEETASCIKVKPFRKMQIIHGIIHTLRIPPYVISVPIDFCKQIDVKYHSVHVPGFMQNTAGY